MNALFKDMIASCYEFYSKAEEDRSNWIEQNQFNETSSMMCPENWEYKTDKQLGGYDSWGRFAIYSGGGYVANLGYNERTANRIIDDLITHDWINRQTRAVITEFSLYNPSSNLVAVMSYYYEVLPSGFAGTFKSYELLPLSATDSQAHNTYLMFAFLFALLLVCYFVTECIKICRQKCSYFISVWNWLDMFQILSASLALLLQWMRSKEAAKTFKTLKENPFVPISFHQALFMFDVENIVICMASVIATLRLLRCFYFNPQVIIFSSTIRRSFRSVASFFVMFVVLSLGHAHLGVIAFGHSFFMFSSIQEAIVSQFLMLLGSNIPIHELKDTSPIVGRLFLFTFISTTIVILGNMFISIINDNYASSLAEKDGEDLELAEFITDRIVQTVFGHKTKEPDPWKGYLNHELFEPEIFSNECDGREDPRGSLSPELSPVMPRSQKSQASITESLATKDTMVNSSEMVRDYSMWETYETGNLPAYRSSRCSVDAGVACKPLRDIDNDEDDNDEDDAGADDDDDDERDDDDDDGSEDDDDLEGLTENQKEFWRIFFDLLLHEKCEG